MFQPCELGILQERFNYVTCNELYAISLKRLSFISTFTHVHQIRHTTV